MNASGASMLSRQAAGFNPRYRLPALILIRPSSALGGVWARLGMPD